MTSGLFNCYESAADVRSNRDTWLWRQKLSCKNSFLTSIDADCSCQLFSDRKPSVDNENKLGVELLWLRLANACDSRVSSRPEERPPDCEKVADQIIFNCFRRALLRATAV